jgi:hypothetical protein
MKPAPGALLVWASAAFYCTRAWAGPPFLTDDPEPVEFTHWEFYLATQWALARGAASGTSPHIEINYGALPGLQLHAIVPAALAWTGGKAAAFGLGDTELGAKLRFVEEGEWRPQVGIFPLITLPTGSEPRGLGAGAVQGLAPLWVQKSFGPFTTYGGGGVRFARDGEATVLGWLLQRELSEKVTLGTEAFFTVPWNGDAAQIQLNLGSIIDFSGNHHLLVSSGPSFAPHPGMQAYLAYQLTI